MRIRAILSILILTVVAATAGYGVAWAAGTKDFDTDNPVVKSFLTNDVRASAAGFEFIPDADGNAVRLYGNTRYETAVAISQFFYADPATAAVVYLATGNNFPDALAGGPNAFIFPGPVLLTERDLLPVVTRDEIARLQPCAVFALGGPSAISRSVIVQAEALTLDCTSG